MRCGVLWCFAWLLLLLPPACVIGEESPGLLLERQVLKERECIAFGRVVISVELSRRGSLVEAGNKVEKTSYTIEFDRDRIRMERTPGAIRRIVTPSTLIAVDKDRIEMLEPIPTSQSKRNDVFHPKYFGLVLSPVRDLDMASSRQVLGFADRSNETVTSETLGGVQVQHVAYDRQIGNHLEYWITSDESPRIVRGIAKIGDDWAETEISWEKHAPGLWYPKTAITREHIKGKVASEELATVETATFEIRPNEERFALTSLSLEVGAVIKHNGQPNIWSGSELTEPDTLASLNRDRGVNPPTNSTRWLLIVNAIVLAVLAAYIAFRKRSRT